MTFLGEAPAEIYTAALKPHYADSRSSTRRRRGGGAEKEKKKKKKKGRRSGRQADMAEAEADD